MFSIQLHQLQFFAHHGLYEAEKINGNNFEVDVDIDLIEMEPVHALSQTVDYVAVYEIIRTRMQQPTQLLETVAQDLAHKIHSYDQRVKQIRIKIKKLNPPIQHFNGAVSVSFTKTY